MLGRHYFICISSSIFYITAIAHRLINFDSDHRVVYVELQLPIAKHKREFTKKIYRKSKPKLVSNKQPLEYHRLLYIYIYIYI